MKILLTCDPEIPVPPGLYGGIERIVEGLIHAFVQKGHTVTLCANAASKVPCRLVAWQGLKSQNAVDTVRNMITLTALVTQEKFDIIHSFSRLAYMLPVMPFHIPKLMSYQREPSLSQISKAVKLSKKSSLRFTGCSDYITNKIKTKAVADTIYNFISTDKYDFKEKTDEDAPLVFLGRIEEIKGTHIAIEAAKKTNKRLIIAGNVPDTKRDYFEEKIKPNLTERIVYIGTVNDRQKNEILGKASALLMPVQWNEPFGIVMAEAMACGTPVLGFPYGAIPEIIQDGVNGFICENADEMAEKVSIISKIERKKVREIAEEKFSDKTIPDQYLALYAAMIK
jgi:glycosyltransferase involved in cell wall biosynthesis